MKYILITLLISVSFGQTLDDQYHSTSEIYAFLDSLNQLEELSRVKQLYESNYKLYDLLL